LSSIIQDLYSPEPRLVTDVGLTYQYSLTVDLVNNLTGGGKVTIGGQTIWEPGYNTGTFNGTTVATDSSGLVFNFLTPYLGRAEFDSVSARAVAAIPVPPSIWLFGSGLLGLIGMAGAGRQTDDCQADLPETAVSRRPKAQLIRSRAFH
jgi:hypothetical protein